MTISPEQAVETFWSGLYDKGRDYRLISSQEISTFLQRSDPASRKTALDIGCGTGQLTRELYHRGYRVVGIDASQRAVEIAKSLTTAPLGQLCYLHCNIEQEETVLLPFQPYGLITCKLVYAFIRNKQAFLTKIISLLDNKGVFVVITPLLEQVPDEKKNIAVSSEAIELLRQNFNEIAWYQENGLSYFVGELKP